MPDLTSCLEGLPRTRRYLVGVSGGRDSVCLLDLLIRAGFRNLVICHFDHGLRGRASVNDARFVERLAKSHGLESRRKRVQTSDYATVQKLSVETAARELRIAFFENIAVEFRCRRLLLAHHADDQVETVFMNLCRGSGLAGLGGMTRESKLGKLTVFRPLLGAWRSEINDYVAAHDLRFRDDASNAGVDHVRNRVRHQLVPILEDVFGRDPREAMLRAAALCREDDALLSELARKTYERTLTKSGLNVRRLSETEAPSLKRRVVQLWLRDNAIPDCGLTEVDRVLSLLDIDDGPAKINLPGNWHARRRSGSIFLEKNP